MFFSELKPIDIIFKEFNGQINANAFVLFASASAFTAALQKDRVNMGKRYIVVKPASRLEYYDAAAARVANERLAQKVPNSYSQTHSYDSEYAVVKMRGLPFNVTYDDIVLFFDGKKCPE